MRILIWGAGPVGLYLGVCLQEAGAEVHFLGRRNVLEPLKNGFLIEEGGKSKQAKPNQIYFDLEEVLDNSYDWAIISFKSYHNQAIAPRLSQVHVQKILIVQNGVGNEEFFMSYHPAVASGAFTKAVHIKNGVLKATHGGIGLAPEEMVKDLGDLFSLKIPVVIYPDCNSMKWSKLLLNIFGSPIACVLDLPPQEYMCSKKGVFLEKALVREFLGLIRKMGIPLVNLPGYPIKVMPALPYFPVSVFRLISKARGEKLPSLLTDYRLRRPLEIGAIILNPLKKAEELGYPMPLTSLIYQTIQKGQTFALNSLYEQYRQSLREAFLAQDNPQRSRRSP
jgi:2-dehydropantoate 2-reductase